MIPLLFGNMRRHKQRLRRTIDVLSSFELYARELEREVNDNIRKIKKTQFWASGSLEKELCQIFLQQQQQTKTNLRKEKNQFPLPLNTRATHAEALYLEWDTTKLDLARFDFLSNLQDFLEGRIGKSKLVATAFSRRTPKSLRSAMILCIRANTVGRSHPWIQ